MKYQKENREEFFAYIEKLTDEDKYTECISALESNPVEERDYKICYQLARAYQNYAIIGDDDKGTPSFIGGKFLLKSIDILNSVREEGQDRAEWNMRMAYAYQYLTQEEERAIPYAMRWAKLDPTDEDALGVLKECYEEIEKRKQMESASTGGELQIENDEMVEDWDYYLCYSFYSDMPAWIRINLALKDFELTSSYPKRLHFQILYKNADENGFPTGEEETYSYQIEDAIINIIKKHGDIFVGVADCDERKHIFVYAKNEVGYRDEISKIMKEIFPEYAYTFVAVEDTNWDMYFNGLYPNKYEYQSIMNKRLVEAIYNNGDSMVPRVLEHCLFFKAKEDRENFLKKVMKEGFLQLESETIDHEAYDTQYPYQLVVIREDAFENIDEIVWYLMYTAEEYDGDYDGWGCISVK